MSLVEAKHFLGTLVLGSAVISIVLLYVAYNFAKISYKKAHKEKKVHQVRKIHNENIIFNIDSKNKTLQEIQKEKQIMMEVLRNE